MRQPSAESDRSAAETTAPQLGPCPRRPNCVSSRDDALPRHRIAPFAVRGDAAAFFARLAALVGSLPRTTVVAVADGYLHAVCRTRLGFADDLEFRLCRSRRVVHVRSGSRTGLFDFGVNRRRVETLRRRLAEPANPPAVG